jgi:ferrochelatase
MRCWRPTIDDAVARIAADGVKRLFVLPLFPQYSLTTSGSCIQYFRATANKTALAGRTEILYAGAWYSEPLYLDAMIETIREAQQRFSSPSPEGIHLLYSSHSIPARYVAEGDPSSTESILSPQKNHPAYEMEF